MANFYAPGMPGFSSGLNLTNPSGQRGGTPFSGLGPVTGFRIGNQTGGRPQTLGPLSGPDAYNPISNYSSRQAPQPSQNAQNAANVLGRYGSVPAAAAGNPYGTSGQGLIYGDDRGTSSQDLYGTSGQGLIFGGNQQEPLGGQSIPRVSTQPGSTAGRSGGSNSRGGSAAFNPFQQAQQAVNQMFNQTQTNNRRSNLMAQQGQTQAANTRGQLGSIVDNATNQQYQEYAGARGVLQGLMNDPQYRELLGKSLQDVENPGFSAAARATLKGNAAQRSAAQSSSGTRNANRAAASAGMSGPARAFMQSMVRNRNASDANRTQRNVDLDIERAGLQDRSRALGQSASLLGMRNNIGGQLANLMGNYNPLGSLSQASGIMSPFGNIGLGLGQNMF